MKKMMILALALVAGASLYTADAAKKKKVAQTEEPAVEKVVLNNSADSISYTAGMSATEGLVGYLLQQKMDTTMMADFVKGFMTCVNQGDDPKAKAYQMGMTIAQQLKERMLPGMKKELTDTPDSIVDPIFYRGFTDALMQDTTLFKVSKAATFFKEKMESNMKARDEKRYGANRDAGKQFLAENARKDSVITLPSGLQYKVLVKGNGKVPQMTDKVKVHYEGRLLDGTVFDSSYKRGEPSELTPKQVIKGWTEALTMMPEGSKWQLYIPYDLAYGDREAGQIKPYSMLIFDVELIEIVTK
jgi:FKBP-type peptidyl-prolyl cis-trans isomerase FklB